MSKMKTGLGRGLDALMNPQGFKQGEASVDYSNLNKDDGEQTDVLAKIPVANVSPNPYQPRTHFEPEAFEELKKSILSNGLIQPITVRRKSSTHYELISGERRLKACSEIGMRDIPAYIIKVDTEEAMLALALIENIQREKLNPIEIGSAYKRLMEECHLTQEQIAEKVGKDRTTVANTIRLLKLPQEIQDSLIKEEITAGHARALINLSSSELQLEALRKIRAGNLSVRKVEYLVRKLSMSPDLKKRTYTLTPQVSSGTEMRDIEDKLQKIFGTKVMCRKKIDGTGEIVIEFYSADELERLFELFETISKNYS
ncbi:MAG: DNA-binding protein [Ignavibacteria bacterium GWA2_35_9]|nr:MAG: DNA-binding protein [Ignavibacteria bacterium GWA2_35_9]OGU53604.1 MAG: DNA-binding protein [Ignavibacteria bacterium GWC2_36_12]OGV16516.1 MAG: DNA-binding protein [Ignavibacteria bacterium RIFOXYA2_FULL_37_17]